jgi:uncharacterized protein YjbI with pentapeptide repeats
MKRLNYLCFFSLCFASTATRADIFQWEYINPANAAEGKQQSTTLCPAGAGQFAEQYSMLQGDLTKAYLIGADLRDTYWFDVNLTDAELGQANLTNAQFYPATLTGANLSQANLTGAYVWDTKLNGADFTGADVRGASFFADSYTFDADKSLTLAQLYSTASYASHDLNGIVLNYQDLSGANFTGQNFTSARFTNSTLAGADFTGADVRGAYFGSYIDDQWLSLSQLYSTASYASHDLTGIFLDAHDLTGANFAGQNLTGATLRSTLTGANLSQANLANASFENSQLVNVILSGADARGASGLTTSSGMTNAANLIQDDGHIAGLNLPAGASLVVRDYDGNLSAFPPTGPLPIIVDQHAVISAGGNLRMQFEADAWDSTISFATAIPVTLGGTLELTFADDINLNTQIGRTFDLFNWDGVSPTGTFAVASDYIWDLSNLYTTGEVTLIDVSLPGDFNHDGTVDAADYIIWCKNPGGIYTSDDYTTWRANFGQSFSLATGSSSAIPLPPSHLDNAVPEPGALVTILMAIAALHFVSRCRGVAKNRC